MPTNAARLHRDAIVVVGHTDIVASDVDWRRESGERKVLDRRHYPTLSAGGATVFCDHIAGDAPYGYLPATKYATSPLLRCMRALDHTYSELAESEHFILVETTNDIRRAKREGKIGIVICFEGGAPLEGEISYLRNFYRLGLRCLGLTHDVRNEIGDGQRERSNGGLTHFGTTVVKECNRLGILVDVSHLCDRGTEDVLAVSSDPITASHSNARALHGISRNLPDPLIKGIAEAGGVIGFHAMGALIGEEPVPSFESMMAHIMHVAEIGGPDSIAIGPDLMENWDPSIMMSVLERSTTICGIPRSRFSFVYPPEFSSNGQLLNLTEWLVKRGVSEDDVLKFLGGNLMRLFDRVWKPKAEGAPAAAQAAE